MQNIFRQKVDTIRFWLTATTEINRLSNYEHIFTGTLLCNGRMAMGQAKIFLDGNNRDIYNVYYGIKHKERMMTMKQLTFRERLACKILGTLKYNENDDFYKCPYNDFVMWIASLLLNRDPVEFIIEILELDPEECQELKSLRD